MKFKEKSTSKFYAFAMAAALALAGCGGGGGAADTTEPTAMPDPAIAQRAAISAAVMAANDAVNALDNDSTDAEVSAAEMAIESARGAIAAAADVPAEERTANAGTVDALAARLDGARMARMEAMDAAQAAQRAADAAAEMAMRARAAELFAGFPEDFDVVDFFDTDELNAVFNDSRTRRIAVTVIGSDPQNISPSATATIPDHHGWVGQKYSGRLDTTNMNGTIDAVAYTNTREIPPGQMFKTQYTGSLTNGVLSETVVERRSSQELVASPSFDQEAGLKIFELPENKNSLEFPGTFHGVSGTYTCAPNEGWNCGVRKVINNARTRAFELTGVRETDSARAVAGVTWTFEPDNADDRVVPVYIADYLGYGRWIYTPDNPDDDDTLAIGVFWHGYGPRQPVASRPCRERRRTRAAPSACTRSPLLPG